MSRKITCQMVADAMGIPVQTLRVAIQYNAFDFAIAIKQKGKVYTYIFFPQKLKEAIPRKIYDSWNLGDYTLEEEREHETLQV